LSSGLHIQSPFSQKQSPQLSGEGHSNDELHPGSGSQLGPPLLEPELPLLLVELPPLLAPEEPPLVEPELPLLLVELPPLLTPEELPLVEPELPAPELPAPELPVLPPLEVPPSKPPRTALVRPPQPVARARMAIRRIEEERIEAVQSEAHASARR
jgi:hypothetical protein